MPEEQSNKQPLLIKNGIHINVVSLSDDFKACQLSVRIG